jgi:acetyl-CoA carboxylase carboxyltransferase component
VVPTEPTSSYDVRDVAEAIVDDSDVLELRAAWAPQIVTALASVGGRPVGIVANQPRALAGTLDIAASQKAARFVKMCDSFNLPIITLVDTPGFLPGKDLEWRGMIRHGAELAFAYAEATVPRVCLILRKAYGGAYIVLDSKGVGNDICLAWPSAEVAVMGSRGAVQILHRRADPAQLAELEAQYAETFLTPWIAAERGFVDAVIGPADTRKVVNEAIALLASRREMLRGRRHDTGPL